MPVLLMMWVENGRRKGRASVRETKDERAVVKDLSIILSNVVYSPVLRGEKKTGRTLATAMEQGAGRYTPLHSSSLSLSCTLVRSNVSKTRDNALGPDQTRRSATTPTLHVPQNFPFPRSTACCQRCQLYGEVQRKNRVRAYTEPVEYDICRIPAVLDRGRQRFVSRSTEKL